MKLVWFRNDLRVRDNPALYQACEDARRGQKPCGVIAVAIICPQQWLSHDDSPNKVAFWLANLEQLKIELSALNIPLKVISGDLFSSVAPSLLELSKRYHCDGLYLNEEYCLNEQQRDDEVESLLTGDGLGFNRFQGDTVIAPGTILNQSKLPYRVYTPFSKAWRSIFSASGLQLYPEPKIQPPLDIESDSIPLVASYFKNTPLVWSQDVWPVGADAAHQKLQNFVNESAGTYRHDRDFPSVDATSSLSPYLAIGVLSPRQCLAGLSSRAQGAEWVDSQWVSEIVWREFYRHLMVLFPQLNRWEPFKPEVEKRIAWEDDARLFKAWSEGETGFPIVDAGMKQLQQTGWMHNRVRMITASFLTKLLRQDWRKGAKFFMQHLIDGDFASNLGGWQWSASVGADAAPYFRIFNPTRQAERFDPGGDYIAHWLPELERLPKKQRLDPMSGHLVGRPAPIIDYKLARAKSLESYSNS
jgi:deoxyribodipyrimidine photo-lyase